MSGPEAPYPSPGEEDPFEGGPDRGDRDGDRGVDRDDRDNRDNRQSSASGWARAIEALIALIERMIFHPSDIPRKRLAQLLSLLGILLLLGIGLGVAWRWGVPTADALNVLTLLWSHVEELLTWR